MPRAKERGVKLGRKPKLTERLKREAIKRRDRLGEPAREIAPQLQYLSQHDFEIDGLAYATQFAVIPQGDERCLQPVLPADSDALRF